MMLADQDVSKGDRISQRVPAVTGAQQQDHFEDLVSSQRFPVSHHAAPRNHVSLCPFHVTLHIWSNKYEKK